MIQIYYGAPSIYGRKALTVLIEKDLDFQIVPVAMKDGEHLKPEYLKLNPNGEIPTIVDDGRVIYESTAIAEYLDEEYPEPPLMPQDTFDRARVRMIDDFIDQHLAANIRKCAIKVLRTKEEITAEDKAAVAEGIRRIEQYLGNQQFLAGKNFTLADCAFMPSLASLELIGMKNLIDEAKPALKAYAARLQARPSYQGGACLFKIPEQAAKSA